MVVESDGRATALSLTVTVDSIASLASAQIMPSSTVITLVVDAG